MTDKACKITEQVYSFQFLPISQQENASTNSFIKSVDELRKEINTASDKIRHSQDQAFATANEWRRKQLENIEQRYLSQCSMIQERFQQLVSLEQDVRTRLSTEIDKPLSNGSLTDETFVAMKHKLDSIRQEVWQLRWNAVTTKKEVPTLKKTVDLPEKHQSFSKLFEEASSNSNKQKITWVGGWAEEAQNHKIIIPPDLNSKKSRGMIFSDPSEKFAKWQYTEYKIS